MGELDSFLLFGSESSRAELFTRVRVAKPTNTPLEPTAEKRGGSAAIRYADTSGPDLPWAVDSLSSWISKSLMRYTTSRRSRSIRPFVIWID